MTRDCKRSMGNIKQIFAVAVKGVTKNATSSIICPYSVFFVGGMQKRLPRRKSHAIFWSINNDFALLKINKFPLAVLKI